MPSFEDRISEAVRRAMRPYVAGRLLEEENLGLLNGLEVKERTSWGLSDTVVLRGPASVDEDGRPTGPDELEIKISSPTRMGLGQWFKDGELYTLEFGPQSEGLIHAQQLNGPIVIPAMTVVERTLWGLSMTCRLRVDAGKGKNIEVKLSLPWPEDRFLKEGQLYSVIFEPVKGEKPEEKDEFESPPDPEEDEQPYRQEGWSPSKLTLQHLDETLGEFSLDRLNEAIRWRPHPAQCVFYTGWFDGQPWEDLIRRRLYWRKIAAGEDDNADDE